ncbi:MAG: hypothetical protein AAFV07_09660 [Bacteroidota bacterium]
MLRDLITLTEYEDAIRAQRHAEFLQRKGIACEVRTASVYDQYVAEAFMETEVWLMVPEDQAEAAWEWIEALEKTPLSYPAGPADSYMLIGAIMALVGMLVLLGDGAQVAPALRFIPLSLTAIGGAIFARGVWYGRVG